MLCRNHFVIFAYIDLVAFRFLADVHVGGKLRARCFNKLFSEPRYVLQTDLKYENLTQLRHHPRRYYEG